MAPTLEKKAEIAALARDASARDEELTRVAEDQQRIRQNLMALSRAGDQRRLAKRYATDLAAAENRLATLRQEAASVRRNLQNATTELHRLIETLAVDIAMQR